MLLFVGIILIYGNYVCCIEWSPMPFDPRLLFKTSTKAHLSLYGKVGSTTMAGNIRNSYNNSAGNNDNIANEVITWECGVDFLTKFISESKIDRDCPRLKKSINQCCIDHDNCYSEQRGRKYCDDTFCTCLDIATKSSKICNKRDGQSFCVIVRNFGEYAYNEAGKESMKTSLPRIFPPRPTRSIRRKN
ncbi:hypothetical protein QQG55_27290 [Brugia pahangi]